MRSRGATADDGTGRKAAIAYVKKAFPAKVRIDIDGRFEIRNGVFPDKDLLFSPAMDEELFRQQMAEKAYFRLASKSDDVTQCFLYNDMGEAEHQRDIVIKLTEYECGIPGGGTLPSGGSRLWVR